MGIKDLLTLYKQLLSKENISNFKGKTCAIDMMVWLYKGQYAMNNNPTVKDIYLNFPLKMISLLKENNIKVIAVFDGKLLPAKLNEVKERISNKIANELLADKLRQDGDIEKSNIVNNRTLNVTPIQINTLIHLLKKLNVQILVAPYEADAQIAYLYFKKKIDFAITEDSDLIPYGVKRIAFKMNENGDFEYLNLNINEISKEKINNLNDESKFLLYLSHLKLVQFCVMLGCDYLKSIKGLGAKTLIRLFKEIDSFDEIIKAISSFGKYKFEEQKGDANLYYEQAKNACSVFYYQIVYDIEEKKLKHLCEDKLWHYFRNVDTLDDIIEKSWIADVIEKNKNKEYYGELFDDFIKYCSGKMDVEKCTENNITMESNEIINKYYLIYCKLINKDIEKEKVL